MEIFVEIVKMEFCETPRNNFREIEEGNWFNDGMSFNPFWMSNRLGLRGYCRWAEMIKGK